MSRCSGGLALEVANNTTSTRCKRVNLTQVAPGAKHPNQSLTMLFLTFDLMAPIVPAAILATLFALRCVWWCMEEGRLR